MSYRQLFIFERREVNESYRDSPYICHRKSCKYHSGSVNGCKESCGYFFITGETKHSHGCVGPGECSLYAKGSRLQAPRTQPTVSPKRPKLQGEKIRKRNRRPKYDWEHGRELYEQGMNDHEIAAALGCDPNTVWNWRGREGLSANVFAGRAKA